MDILIEGLGLVTPFVGGLQDWMADPATREGLGEAVRIYWTVLSWATVYAALMIFVSSVDDTFLDLYFWVLSLQNLLTRPFRRIPSVEGLRAMPEKRLAILIPAWQEADVIARMVDHTVQELDYSAYDIFIGVYPNDAATISETDALVARHANVYRANVGHPGPTSKADCLNWIVQNALAREAQTGKRYDAFVMHDSEDVIHPLSFRVMNAWLDRADMVQLPVLSMPRPWNALVAGHYMDEFAEWHSKDLVARAHMTGQVPSAGVATALSRRVIDLLNAERDNLPFNTDSLTEDYDIGHRLFEGGFKSAFVRYFARVKVTTPDGKKRTRRELVCTREFFPVKMKVAVRQKSRWMLGISFMGWRQLGWSGPLVHRYFLYRDRKAIWTAPTGMLAYFIVVQWSLYWLIATLVPEAGTLPPLIDPQSWVWAIVLINFWFLVNRVIHRLIFTGTTHGIKLTLLAPVAWWWLIISVFLPRRVRCGAGSCIVSPVSPSPGTRPCTPIPRLRKSAAHRRALPGMMTAPPAGVCRKPSLRPLPGLNRRRLLNARPSASIRPSRPCRRVRAGLRPLRRPCPLRWSVYGRPRHDPL